MSDLAEHNAKEISKLYDVIIELSERVEGLEDRMKYRLIPQCPTHRPTCGCPRCRAEIDRALARTDLFDAGQPSDDKEGAPGGGDR